MTNHQAIQLLIIGKVQGVGYRRWFEKEALRLQLLGYVRNLPTGEVEAVIMGQDSQLAEMIRHSGEMGRCERRSAVFNNTS